MTNFVDCPMCLGGAISSTRQCSLCADKIVVRAEVAGAWRLGGLRTAMEINAAVRERVHRMQPQTLTLANTIGAIEDAWAALRMGKPVIGLSSS